MHAVRLREEKLAERAGDGVAKEAREERVWAFDLARDALDRDFSSMRSWP
jgi:hypothetical protein